MNRCPITYEECGRRAYSAGGLKKLSPNLKRLKDFPYSAEKQRREAVMRAARMSIQGVQPKLSVRLYVEESIFKITDRGGQFIIKPQHRDFPELPENEDLTMRLAAEAGIEVPLHGLIYSADGTMSYFIKRFDRHNKTRKYAMEDFAQLAGADRETKYDYSIEKLIRLLDHCTFPAIERAALFRRLIFNFLTGNEDMHLKNFSLIRRDNKIEMAPAYDFLNTTIAYLAMGKRPGGIEESALPLKGRKRRLTKSIWMDYLAKERLQLSGKTIAGILEKMSMSADKWESLIRASFLSGDMKKRYVSILNQRRKNLGL